MDINLNEFADLLSGKIEGAFSGKLERLEGKIDLVANNQKDNGNSLKALHRRVDSIEEDVVNIRTDQKLFKRDVKWIVAIGAAFLAVGRWLAGILIK